MGEMEELRKEADNLKEQITVSPDPPVAIPDFSSVSPPPPSPTLADMRFAN